MFLLQLAILQKMRMNSPPRVQLKLGIIILIGLVTSVRQVLCNQLLHKICQNSYIMIYWYLRFTQISYTQLFLHKQASSAGKTLEEHEEICRLTVSDSNEGKNNTACAFPFRYNGTKWDGVCTNSGVCNIQTYFSDKLSELKLTGIANLFPTFHVILN